jgi:hypothetical protein
MADFIEKAATKTAVRDLAEPVADLATFDAIIAQVESENPFGCEDFEEAGMVVPGVMRSREQYTAKVIYQDPDGKTAGTASARAPNVGGFNAAAAELVGNAALASALGGEAVRDAAHDSYYCRLRCHDPSGEDYYVTFTRKAVRITSYQDDAVRDLVEAWADTVPALA